LRTVPALLLYLGLLLFSGRVNELFLLPLRALVYLVGSTLVGMLLGDLLYFRSMKLIGLSRAMPLSTTYPFFTLLLALTFLDEEFSWTVVAGALLIAGGAYLLAFPRGAGRFGRGGTAGGVNLGGVALALGAAVCWAVSTVMLRVGLEGVDVTLANALRLSVLLAVLVAMLATKGEAGRVRNYAREYGLRSLGIVFLSGIVGIGLGSFTFVAAVQLAGAAKTSILTASTPLFGVPLSLLLKEKPAARALLGTALTVVGVWLTI
jgi:DME family drug/metabolite transporter